MKNFLSQSRWRWVFPLLLAAALVTFPSAVTQSKYVWKEEINITLKINCQTPAGASVENEPEPADASPENEPEPADVSVENEPEPAGVSPDSGSMDGWQLQLANIQAVPHANGLVLSVEEGYMLPESIQVQVGESLYSIHTDGLNNPQEIAFDPQTGSLSVPDAWITEGENMIIVTASALQVP